MLMSKRKPFAAPPDKSRYRPAEGVAVHAAGSKNNCPVKDPPVEIPKVGRLLMFHSLSTPSIVYWVALLLPAKQTAAAKVNDLRIAFMATTKAAFLMPTMSNQAEQQNSTFVTF